MSKEYVEYAVLTRCNGKETLDESTITKDIGNARFRRDCKQNAADYRTEKAGDAPATCVLVMRTCTPWCDVWEPKEKENKQ